MSTRSLLITTGVIGLVIGIVGVEFLIANHSINPNAIQQNCQGKHANHLVTLNGKTAAPETTTAPLCDTITFKNIDATNVLVAFGPHDDHQAYDGVLEHELRQGESFTILLNKSGSFHFHDHLEDIIDGHFIVTQ